ncbi:hypothetical protein ACWD25_59585 [Streptomyces sp. NPDC002920]
MADHSKPVPNTRLRAVRELEFQMSRREFAKKINDTGRAMGENVACGPRLGADWEDGNVLCPRAVYQRILTQMTRVRSMADPGFRLPTPARPAARPQGPQEDSAERRDFLFDGAGVLLALPLGTGQTPGRSARARYAPSKRP